MKALTVIHGDLAIEQDDKGNVRFVRQSNAQSVSFTRSEWGFVVKVSELFGWPVVSDVEMPNKYGHNESADLAGYVPPEERTVQNV